MRTLGSSYGRPLDIQVHVDHDDGTEVMNLASIRVLWRQPDVMALWGIPYPMRPKQSPMNLWESTKVPDTAKHAAGHYGHFLATPGPREGWIWLGSPGWWGHLTPAQQAAIATYLEPLQARDLIPVGPNEWIELP
jgi:hypothetical protein